MREGVSVWMLVILLDASAAFGSDNLAGDPGVSGGKVSAGNVTAEVATGGGIAEGLKHLFRPIEPN